MFKLENAISEWKNSLRRSPSLDDGDRVELERYLRDKIEDQLLKGLSPEEAFRTAEAEFIKAGTLDAAYGQARAARPAGRFPWRPGRFSPGLLRSYFRIALRRLRLQKSFSIINIGGLALGLACTFLIFIWVWDELGYDRFHAKADRIFRVVFSTSGDGAPTNANGSFGVGPALKRDFPEVLETVRIRKMEQNPKRYVGYRDKKFYEPRLFFAEPSLFTVFDFPLLRGDAATALTDPGSVVLTEDMARKYFGSEDPIGKVLESDPDNDGRIMPLRVTGIAKNVPRQSHFHFDFIVSYSSLTRNTASFEGLQQHFTYALLKDASSVAALTPPRLQDFLERNWQPNPWYSISFQPLREIHLRSGLRSEIEPVGNRLYIYVFSAIALAVLLIACINFMNLATARSFQRAKEVGIRKAVGAPRSQLIRQFLGESLSMSAVSTGAAFLILISVLPWFSRLSGKRLTSSVLAEPPLLLAAAAIALVVGLVSGIYPAFVLSAHDPVRVLKSRSKSSVSGARLRRVLVVFQFALSIGIVFCTLVIRDQMSYIRSRDLGFDRDQILVLPLNEEIRRNYDAFRNELLKNPGIENAATSELVPTSGTSHSPVNFEGGAQNLTQVFYLVDKDFMATYGIKLMAGRAILRPITEGGSTEFLISEESAREAGYASPRDAIGKRAILPDQEGQVVGIVHDVNLSSLHRPHLPIIYAATPITMHKYLSVRIQTRNVPQILAHIRRTWQEASPSFPLDYSFLDTDFEQMHIAEQRMSEMFSVFSVLAIVIACLGLFGLAAFTAEQKTKEIGIRKVLGASSSSILVMLSREFLKWVALGNVLAWPAAYFAMSQWLGNFAFRIGIGASAFLASAAAALAAAALTVGSQTLRTARANPVESLRYE